MSLFICGNDSCYFYFYRFDASSPMVSSSLSPLPSGGKLDPPVRITLSNQVLRSYQVVNRLVPIVDVWMFGSVVSRVQSVDKNHFRHFVLSYKISQALPILSTSRRKKQAYPPLTSPKQCCVTPPAATNESTSVGGGGGGVWSRLYVFPNSPFGDSVCGERFFGRFVGYTWVVLNRNACQLVVTNILTTCADITITAIVTDCHLVAVYVFFVFVTKAILSSPFSVTLRVTRSNPNLLLTLKHINTCLNSNN